MSLLPDKTCSHGKPLQVSCHKCTGSTRSTPPAAKKVNPQTRTSGSYRTNIFGKTTKTSRNAKK